MQHNIDSITENILSNILSKFKSKNLPTQDSNPNATLIARRQHQFNSRDSFNTSWKREDQPDISHIINSIRDLNPEQKKIFSSQYKENFGDTYPDKLSPEQLSNLQDIIKSLSESHHHKLKESNTPPTLPLAQKHLELANQLLTKAIDEFHLAMDSDKSLKIFPLVMQLENLETKINNNK